MYKLFQTTFEYPAVAARADAQNLDFTGSIPVANGIGMYSYKIGGLS
jgi:hypothetical protein